jgi:hypothetical protein
MMYLEPAKFVAKLSELKTDGSSCYSSAISVLGTSPTQEGKEFRRVHVITCSAIDVWCLLLSSLFTM